MANQYGLANNQSFVGGQEPYYVDGDQIRKRPVKTNKENGRSSVSLGFPICKLHDACKGQETTLATLLNLGTEALARKERVNG